MSALILFGIVIFMIFGVFPITLMVYATIRDKRAASQAKDASSTGSSPQSVEEV
jgi:hypothetical protein